jgi:hypothetical protein
MEVEQLLKIKKSLSDRKYARQIQAAKKGIDTDPEITIEIRDLKAAITAINDLVNLAIEQNINYVDPSGIADTLREVNVIV